MMKIKGRLGIIPRIKKSEKKSNLDEITDLDSTEKNIPHTSLGYMGYFDRGISMDDLQTSLNRKGKFKKMPSKNVFGKLYFIDDSNEQETEVVIEEVSDKSLVKKILVKPNENQNATKMLKSYELIKNIMVELYTSYNLLTTAYLGGKKLSKDEFISGITNLISSLRDTIREE